MEFLITSRLLCKHFPILTSSVIDLSPCLLISLLCMSSNALAKCWIRMFFITKILRLYYSVPETTIVFYKTLVFKDPPPLFTILPLFIFPNAVLYPPSPLAIVHVAVLSQPFSTRTNHFWLVFLVSCFRHTFIFPILFLLLLFLSSPVYCFFSIAILFIFSFLDFTLCQFTIMRYISAIVPLACVYILNGLRDLCAFPIFPHCVVGDHATSDLYVCLYKELNSYRQIYPLIPATIPIVLPSSDVPPLAITSREIALEKVTRNNIMTLHSSTISPRSLLHPRSYFTHYLISTLHSIPLLGMLANRPPIFPIGYSPAHSTLCMHHFSHLASPRMRRFHPVSYCHSRYPHVTAGCFLRPFLPSCYLTGNPVFLSCDPCTLLDLVAAVPSYNPTIPFLVCLHSYHLLQLHMVE